MSVRPGKHNDSESGGKCRIYHRHSWDGKLGLTYLIPALAKQRQICLLQELNWQPSQHSSTLSAEKMSQYLVTFKIRQMQNTEEKVATNRQPWWCRHMSARPSPGHWCFVHQAAHQGQSVQIHITSITSWHCTSLTTTLMLLNDLPTSVPCKQLVAFLSDP